MGAAESTGPRDFYPRPPRGGRRSCAHSDRQSNEHFYPRPPRGGRQRPFGQASVLPTFLSTSPAWGTTQALAGGGGANLNFYPRPPRGGRLRRFCGSVFPLPFLSTSPAWGTTRLRSRFPGLPVHFYPRPPRGGRLTLAITGQLSITISIHVPRVGDDARVLVVGVFRHISIHVPRVGDDGVLVYVDGIQRINFYPRPPRGGRQTASDIVTALKEFLSTSPAWGTTICQ